MMDIAAPPGRAATDASLAGLPLLRPGATAWRVAGAGRAAVLLDSAAYFAAARVAIERARHSVLMLGWDFDPRMHLCAPSAAGPTPEDELGHVLRQAVARNPALDLRVLIWDMPAPLLPARNGFPRRAEELFHGSGVHFRLDRTAPSGACHHQKLLVVDDAIAFCSGGDFAADRWDTPRHPDHDPRRRTPSGEEHPPRHEVTLLLDGPLAAALGELARERWRHATGEALVPPPPLPANHDPWPGTLPPDLGAPPRVGILRTLPGWMRDPPVQECEPMHLAAIAAARRLIYLENQYFASTTVADALAARLKEPDGPEVVVVVSARSPSFFDRAAMDAPRDALVARLRAADPHGRFRAYAPHTVGGRPIIVHSKVSIIDDRLLRIGSANLNNRSGGWDTECDLALETPTAASTTAEAIRRFRNRLIAHFLGMDAARVAATQARLGDSLGQAIEALETATASGGRRLVPLMPPGARGLGSLVAALQLGDPHGPGDVWRPWRRRRKAGGT
jgi:phosphatidylserine/phosphatidylglycerophosphate/cardiolipin synthase-like enzyme